MSTSHRLFQCSVLVASVYLKLTNSRYFSWKTKKKETTSSNPPECHTFYLSCSALCKHERQNGLATWKLCYLKRNHSLFFSLWHIDHSLIQWKKGLINLYGSMKNELTQFKMGLIQYYKLEEMFHTHSLLHSVSQT